MSERHCGFSLHGGRRQMYLVPDEGVELQDDRPGVPDADPVGVAPCGQRLGRPIVYLHRFQLPCALPCTLTPSACSETTLAASTAAQKVTAPNVCASSTTECTRKVLKNGSRALSRGVCSKMGAHIIPAITAQLGYTAGQLRQEDVGT